MDSRATLNKIIISLNENEKSPNASLLLSQDLDLYLGKDYVPTMTMKVMCIVWGRPRAPKCLA